MKTVKLIMAADKSATYELKSDISYVQLQGMLSNASKPLSVLTFETKEGCIILPAPIWENCIIELS